MDNLSPTQRSHCMSRVRSKQTNLESVVGTSLRARGLRFVTNVRGLPGSPDIVFPRYRVAVFVDGDFWHGWRFPAWRSSVADFWREKLEGNRRRDLVAHRQLRRMGWKVIRVWQHQIERDLGTHIRRIEMAVSMARLRRSRQRGVRNQVTM
jgi:DNA mismatch endonuclease (patch repair protein)